MADSLKAGQLLDVEVDQLARALALIAPVRLLHVQSRQPTQSAPGEPSRHGGAGKVQLAADLLGCELACPFLPM
jgi:hypothetical protein